jgi:hypothetical protein
VVLTVATAVAEEFHVAELVRFCVFPSLNVPVAVNCWVAPLMIEGLAGVTAIEVSVGVGVGVGVGAGVGVPPPPHPPAPSTELTNNKPSRILVLRMCFMEFRSGAPTGSTTAENRTLLHFMELPSKTELICWACTQRDRKRTEKDDS